VDFRKTYYILPNLFTLCSVMCGFASIAFSSEPDGGNLYFAALAICFGFFFDTVDGRVARLTKTQTDLGRDLDSLADVITFGAAPALMMYRWGLTHFGNLGIFFAGLFVCAGAMRLARFNVLERRAVVGGYKGPSKFSIGLSIPPAASVLVFMVIVSHHAGQYRAISETSTAVVVLVLSFLMVSRVRFRSFKDLRLTRRTIVVVVLIGGSLSAVVAAGFKRAFIFMLLVSAYIALGLAEEVIFFRRRRAEARANVTPASPPETTAAQQTAQDAQDDKDDEEVLRELGAFDDVSEPTGSAKSSPETIADPVVPPHRAG
jgi:CDP-diacylglycerol---serine O-phosphatidyltransferase